MAAHSGYQKVRVPLLQEGVELYEVRALIDDTRGSGQGRRVSRYGNYALHAKLYVFDRARLFVGSWNYDQRSLRINTEIGLIIESGELAGQVATPLRADDQAAGGLSRGAEDHRRKRPALTWNTEINHSIRNRAGTLAWLVAAAACATCCRYCRCSPSFSAGPAHRQPGAALRPLKSMTCACRHHPRRFL